MAIKEFFENDGIIRGLGSFDWEEKKYTYKAYYDLAHPVIPGTIIYELELTYEGETYNYNDYKNGTITNAEVKNWLYEHILNYYRAVYAYVCENEVRFSRFRKQIRNCGGMNEHWQYFSEELPIRFGFAFKAVSYGESFEPYILDAENVQAVEGCGAKTLVDVANEAIYGTYSTAIARGCTSSFLSGRGVRIKPSIRNLFASRTRQCFYRISRDKNGHSEYHDLQIYYKEDADCHSYGKSFCAEIICCGKVVAKFSALEWQYDPRDVDCCDRLLMEQAMRCLFHKFNIRMRDYRTVS